MTSDYRSISAYNEEMLGKDRASRMSQVSMYADTAHFVFEILQNADDAGATEVEFQVFEDRLVIEHNGTPFTADDVRAISYFGKGKTDITKIGHFGLGFKSVFAYTASPSVHSGQESFEITELYTLRAAPMPDDLKRGRTRFVLPFDHLTSRPAYIESGKLKTAAAAVTEITAKLVKLGPETLLFTRNLAEISWTAGGKPGHYLREERSIDNGARELRIVTPDGKESCFLVFEQPVDASGSEASPAGRLVQIAYKLTKRLLDGGEIRPVTGARLFVFFQTDKETHTGLILQAPYRTTPARDNIPEDDVFNRQLVRQSAELLVESLRQLKRLNLLSLEVLSALPLDFERFAKESFFHPMHAAVRDALTQLPLLPTSTGGFVPAREAKLARGAELTRVFAVGQLEALLEHPGVRWLAPALTSAKYPALHQLLVGKRLGYFYSAEWASEPLADGIEMSAEDFAPLLTAAFFEAQSDEWVADFMGYVGKAGISAFHDIPVVRLESGAHVVAKGKDGQPNAYLPPPDVSAEIGSLPLVKASLLVRSDVLRFLEDDLELGPPDLADFALSKILPRYQEDAEEVDVDQWEQDFRVVVSALATDSHEKRQRLLQAISEALILMGVLPRDREELVLVDPSRLYFSSPEIDEYFAGDDDFYVTPPDVYTEDDADALLSMGVARLPRIVREQRDYQGHVSISSYHGRHQRGLDGFDPAWTIDGLANAVQNPTPTRSRVLWRLLLSDSSCIRGTVESSTRQSFENATRKDVISDSGRLLLESPWLLRDDGTFVRPCDIGLEDLPTEFEKASTEARILADKLGMKKADEQEAISVLARGSARKQKIAEFLLTASDDEVEKLEKLIPKRREIAEFKSFKEGMQLYHRVAVDNPPEDPSEATSVAHPERYRSLAEEAVREQVEKQRTSLTPVTFSVARDVSPNKNAREFLTQEYQGRCQVTGQTFQKRTGGNYFEALSLVSRLGAEHLNDPGNMLCLSAEVAAQFMYAEFAWIDDIEDKILSFKAEVDGGTIEMRQMSAKVAGRTLTITWSERHFLRLRALWNAA